ncbi:hypothetical protein LY41_001839 [Prauserella halophila]|nr:hypothetical protein [Prauserella halophila]
MCNCILRTGAPQAGNRHLGTQHDGDPRKGSEQVAAASPEKLNERGRPTRPSQEVQMHGFNVLDAGFRSQLAASQPTAPRSPRSTGACLPGPRAARDSRRPRTSHTGPGRAAGLVRRNCQVGATATSREIAARSLHRYARYRQDRFRLLPQVQGRSSFFPGWVAWTGQSRSTALMTSRSACLLRRTSSPEARWPVAGLGGCRAAGLGQPRVPVRLRSTCRPKCRSRCVRSERTAAHKLAQGSEPRAQHLRTPWASVSAVPITHLGAASDWQTASRLWSV